MLNHWLTPAPAVSGSGRPPAAIGRRLTHLQDITEEWPKGAVALVGYEPKAAAAVRRELYNLTWQFGKLPVLDLGDLRKSEPSFAVQVLRELTDAGTIAILIGADPELPLYQYQAYGEKMKGVNACLVNAHIPYLPEPGRRKEPLLNRMLKPGENHLFHLSLLGLQRHTVDPQVWREFTDAHHFELIGLGQVRTQREDMEPTIRDADMLAVSLAAVQAGTAPAARPAGPNGLDGLEICHLTRYAGLSDKLSSLSISGWAPSRDRQRCTAQLIAQMVWYFCEGVAHRTGDFPVSMDGLIEYQIAHDHFPDKLIFWKSNRSGRWWVQVPVREGADEENARHRLVPCTYSDYQEACRNELPDRVMQAQFRFR